MITTKLVTALLSEQCPQWKDLNITPVSESGWDNVTFRLGDAMLLRFPSAESYNSQVLKEYNWLPRLAKQLPLQIPKPLFLGQPSERYPLHWSVYQWIDGELPEFAHISKDNHFASQLGGFLQALQRCDTADAPLAGPDTFYRGADLSVYDAQAREAIALLSNKIDTQKALSIWADALSSRWDKPLVWLHGDMSIGNVLVQGGKLHAVIDFGQACVGDPACDLVPYWTMFESAASECFKDAVALDAETWARARGWALWKFALVVSGLTDWQRFEALRAGEILARVLAHLIS